MYCQTCLFFLCSNVLVAIANCPKSHCNITVLSIIDALPTCRHILALITSSIARTVTPCCVVLGLRPGTLSHTSPPIFDHPIWIGRDPDMIFLRIEPMSWQIPVFRNFLCGGLMESGLKDHSDGDEQRKLKNLVMYTPRNAPAAR